MTPDEAVELAQDPASKRIDMWQAIEMHKLHIEGVAWQEIAEKFDTTRSNVQRIIQGRRHRSVHPKVAGIYYQDVVDSEPVDDGNVPQLTQEQREQLWQLAEIGRGKGGMRAWGACQQLVDLGLAEEYRRVPTERELTDWKLTERGRRLSAQFEAEAKE